MILNPAIIALIGGGLLVSAFAVYAALNGALILRHWDLRSGSEHQLALERKTYLVSTIFSYLLGFEFLSLFLLVHTADHMHTIFVGAMCAAGSLNVNGYGYMTLCLKLITLVLCGIWLILNYADNRGYDYPLIRPKYKVLLVLAGLLLLETLLQTAYLTGLRADVITSCCGTLFSENVESVAGAMAGLPSLFAEILLLSTMVLMFRSGIHFMATGRGAGLFAGVSVATLILSVVSVVSFISVYYYQLPTHHCPFCLLQKEYGYIGYPLYLFIFLGGIAGAGVGALHMSGGPESLKNVLPLFKKRLCLVSMAAYLIFGLIAAYPMVFSDFTLTGY
jgi:hypothetical protein